MAGRPQSPKFTTPRGTFKFPKLNEADTKFKKEGEFSVKMIFDEDAPDVQALLAKLVPLHAAAIEAAEQEFKNLPIKARKTFEAKGVTGPVVNALYTPVYDEQTERPTGQIEMKFGMAASGEYRTGPKTGQKWTRKPALFDAKGQIMTKAAPIWGGTVGKVSFEVGLNKDGAVGYFIPGTAAAGLSLRLQAAQIIELVSGGEKNAAGHGFGAEEDGYEYAEPADAQNTEAGDPGNTGGDF